MRADHGGYKLLKLAERRGWLNKIVRYRITPGVTLDVPVFRPENRWTAGHVKAYEVELVDALSASARAAAHPPVLVDCGADIGTISVLVTARSSRVGRIVAIEPDPDSHLFLERNLDRLPVSAQSLNAAVADFAGRGTLRRPDSDADRHAQFLAPEPDGDVCVVTIDGLGIEAGASVILKLDLEGGERAALRGARETLESATDFTVAFEAHPDVDARTGTEAMDTVRLLTAIRPCTVTVAEVPELDVDLDRPLFSQIASPKTRGYNVVCRSVAPS